MRLMNREVTRIMDLTSTNLKFSRETLNKEAVAARVRIERKVDVEVRAYCSHPA